MNPGQTATPGAGNAACTTGVAPNPGVVGVTASNASSVSSNVVVLGYGCIYQGGFVFSVDDTMSNNQIGMCTTITPCSGSMGGKIVSLVDQAGPRINTGPQASSTIWSSNGNGSTLSNLSYDIIPWIAETSTPNDTYNQAEMTFNATYFNTSTNLFPSALSFATCIGATDGACNSNNILALYNTYKTNYGTSYLLQVGATSATDYVVGLCSQYSVDSLGNSPCGATGTCYNKWYVPAICEMDSLDEGAPITCPAIQSIVSTLPFLLGDPDPSQTNPSTSCNPPTPGTNCFAGNYWSSTELASDAQNQVWGEGFAASSAGGSYQGAGQTKQDLLGGRCVRALSP